MKFYFKISFTFTFLFLVFSGNSQKATSELQEAISNAKGEPLQILIHLKEKANLAKFANRSKNDKRIGLVKTLQSTAKGSQVSLLKKLDKLKRNNQVISYESLWVINAVQATIEPSAIIDIEKIQNVEIIGLYPTFEVLSESQDAITSFDNSLFTGSSQPNHKAINAHRLWELGYTGTDTKVLLVEHAPCSTHPAISNSFLGNSVPIAEAWNSTVSPTSCQGDSHANGVLGIVLGLNSSTNDTLGVAFDAKWMYGSWSISTLQWALDPDGNPNTTNDIPDVMNCSIYFGDKFNCSTEYQGLLENLEFADVSVIWAAGNSGPNTQSILYPQNLVFSIVNPFAVGAISHAQLLDGSRWPLHPGSSLGPSRCGGTGSFAIKPEVVAPSIGTYTASSGNGYQVTGPGTSWAAPHVVGAAALLHEAYPTVSAFDIKSALYYTARDLGQVGEDNSYGTGVIDAFAAYQYLSMTCLIGITAVDFPISGNNNIVNTSRVLGTSNINSGANATWKAGVDIDLKEGFHAKYGSNFSAELGGCALKSSNLSFSEEEIKTNGIIEKGRNYRIGVDPNPSNSVVTLKFKGEDQPEEYALMIANSIGQIMYYKEKVSPGENTIDISSWKSGIYYFRIHTRDNTILVEKLIKN